MNLKQFLLFGNKNSLKQATYFKGLLLKKSVLYFMIAAFLSYGFVIHSFIDNIDCINIDDIDSRTFISSSPNFECWTGLHLYAAAPVSFLGILIWGLIFPLGLWRIMSYPMAHSMCSSSYMSQSINNMSNSNIEQKKEFDFEKNTKIFDETTLQFFNKGFKKEYYYWQCIIFIQKLLITLFAKFKAWTGYQPFQWLNLSFLLILLYYTDCFEPFKRHKINKLELYSLLTTFITNLSIVCLATNLPISWHLIFYLLLVISNLLFFTHSLYLVLRYTDWKEIINNSNKITNSRTYYPAKKTVSSKYQSQNQQPPPPNFKTIIVQEIKINKNQDS